MSLTNPPLIITPLIIKQYGTRLSLKGERLIIDDKQQIREIPLMDLHTIFVEREQMSITGPLIKKLAEYGISLFFINFKGKIYSQLSSPQHEKHLSVRKAQYKATENALGCTIAHQIINSKIESQWVHIKQIKRIRNLTDEQQDVITESVNKLKQHLETSRAINICDLNLLRPKLLNIEAQAARQYWKALQQVIPKHLDFTHRAKQDAEDPVNQMLNYGYSILFGLVNRYASEVGLDTACGFIHADHDHRDSLVCDLMELLRIRFVDRIMLKLILRYHDAELQEEKYLNSFIRKKLALTLIDGLQAPYLHFENLQHALLKDIKSLQKSLKTSEYWLSSFQGDWLYKGNVA